MTFIAFLYGSVLALIGLTMVVHSRALIAPLQAMVQSSPVRIGLVLLFFPLGVAGVFFHNDWTWGPGIAVTLLAWILFIKPVAIVLLDGFTEWWVQVALKRFDWVLWMRLEGLGLVLWGLLCYWQAMRLSAQMVG